MAKLVIEAEQITREYYDADEETRQATIIIDSKLFHQDSIRIDIDGVGYFIKQEDIADMVRFFKTGEL